MFTSFGVVVLAIPLYVRDELAAGDFEVGVAIGAASVGAIVAGPAAGRLADRRGRRIVLVVAYTMASDLAPAGRQGEAMSIVTAASYCGLALGPIGADVVVDAAGYPAAWLAAAALVAAAGAAASASPEARPDADEQAPRGFLPPRSALLPGLVLLLELIGFGGFNAFAALHAREVGSRGPDSCSSSSRAS